MYIFLKQLHLIVYLSEKGPKKSFNSFILQKTGITELQYLIQSLSKLMAVKNYNTDIRCTFNIGKFLDMKFMIKKSN